MYSCILHHPTYNKSYTCLECLFQPEIRWDYPLNLSISVSGGKETNNMVHTNFSRGVKWRVFNCMECTTGGNMTLHLCCRWFRLQTQLAGFNRQTFIQPQLNFLRPEENPTLLQYLWMLRWPEYMLWIQSMPRIPYVYLQMAIGWNWLGMPTIMCVHTHWESLF